MLTKNLKTQKWKQKKTICLTWHIKQEEEKRIFFKYKQQNTQKTTTTHEETETDTTKPRETNRMIIYW